MVLCIVYAIFTNAINLWNIFLIFYDDLNFCYCTIFRSIKSAVKNFITSTLYFTKSVIYLRDITVSTKELFQIRLTLISNSSNCENMIALFLFSVVILFFLLPHKRDLRLKACIPTFFVFFSISHFSSKRLISWEYPMNPLKLLILLAWFVSIESRTCFAFPISGTGTIRFIFNCYYYFLGVLVLTQDLLFLNSITMISGLFLKREVFILCIVTQQSSTKSRWTSTYS